MKRQDQGTNEIVTVEKKLLGDDLRLYRCSSSLKLKFKVHVSRANTNFQRRIAWKLLPLKQVGTEVKCVCSCEIK